MKLVECVPNFSEGRDRGIIGAITEAISSVEGVRLLDVDPGVATNRTVVTFVGEIPAVEEAAFLAIRKAASLIDLRAHKGAHPRMGATDVCPFVPLGDTAMGDCVELARRVGRRVGEDLGIPVYLYEEAATSPSRKSLSAIRTGEYEGLRDRLRDPAWAPDFGPAELNARSGATAVGAREFLIAYNVNLNTRDRRLATRIAQNIRETGRPKRGEDGKVLRDGEGRAITEPGPSLLEAVRATGWYIEEYGRAQVSINLTDFKVTPPHKVFDTVELEAARLGLRVTGSEVVGLIPLEAVRAAGRHYLTKQGKSPTVPESELVRAAVTSLGLSDVAPFDPSRKIIEYRVTDPPRLVSMTVAAFSDEVAGISPAPGGGSVAALAGSLAAGLTAMIASITYEREESEEARQDLARLGTDAHELRSAMLRNVDEDATAFDRVLEAGRMPRKTDAERQLREEALQKATLGAIEVPLSVMKDGLRVIQLAGEVAERGVPAALSDAGVAALAAAAAVEGAYYNVVTNLTGLTGRTRRDRLHGEASELLAKASELKKSIAARVRQKLESP